VQRPEDVVQLQQELARRRRGTPLPPVVLKIETALAVRNLPRLIVTAGGRQPLAVMIARGDLAVEIGLARLSEIQEQILWICEAAHVPVIWATQVLDSLVRDGAASRSEATDAARRVRDAQQGAAPGRGHPFPGRSAAADGPAPAQEVAAARAARLVERAADAAGGAGVSRPRLPV
jgi:pyruvate kinase